MASRDSSTVVPYTAKDMFALVADVERYPDFLPWCVALRIIASQPGETVSRLTADMVVAYKVFRERFRSRVTLNAEDMQIDAEYVDGPFRSLQNRWRFVDLAGGGSVVEFHIDFEFRSFLLQATAMTVFERAFARMSDAFVERAHSVYGDGRAAVKAP